MNSDIRAREVRLIDTDGAQLGVLSLRAAQGVAEARGMDLVEVAGEARPPVCRIMDFHKFRYEQRKKNQESKRKSTASSVKEVKIRSRTEAHDIEFKIGHVLRFLEKGHRVKVSVFFKGREITRPELGRNMLERVLEEISEFATPEGQPRMEGRHMSVIVVPAKKPPAGKKDKSDQPEESAKSVKSAKAGNIAGAGQPKNGPKERKDAEG